MDCRLLEMLVELIIIWMVKYGQSSAPLTDFNYSRCGDEYLFISTPTNQPDSKTTCQSRGYGGLAVISQSYQLQDLKLIITAVAERLVVINRDAVWIGLEYQGPGQYDWGWKANGVWLNQTTDFTMPWPNGEPNKGDTAEPCTRVVVTPEIHSKRFEWRTFKCDVKKYPLCYRRNETYEVPKQQTMILLNSNIEPPTGKARLHVRSLLDCQVVCIKQCVCIATYYHNNMCYIIMSRDDTYGNNGETGSYKLYSKFTYLYEYI